MFAALLPSCLLLLLLAACHSSDQSGQNQAKAIVTDFVVKAETLPAIFDFIGFAQSSHPVEIRARVEGYLDEIAYQEGELVKQNQLLYQLDPKQYEAKVAQAKAEVTRQEALLANAQLTVDRLTPLYQQKAASKKDLDNATANLFAVQAQWEAAKAQLLDSQINLGYTTIRSPITGVADKTRYYQGALVNPGSNSLLTTISVLDPIWVYFTVSDNDILQTTHQSKNKSIILPKEGEYEVEALMSDGSLYSHKGKVNFSSPTYEQSTGTLLVRAVFPNPEKLLRPGQFVRVKVLGATRPNALFVPQRALLQKKNGMFVYLLDADNKVSAQDVSTGEWYGDYQIITNGLKPGDHIVVDGINKVRPGMTVDVSGAWK